MQTTITARHCEISDELRARAVAVVERLAGLSHRAMDAAVVFDQTPDGGLAEIRFHLRGPEVLVGTGDGADHRTALDRAEEKIRRQLERESGGPRRGHRVEKDSV